MKKSHAFSYLIAGFAILFITGCGAVPIPPGEEILQSTLPPTLRVPPTEVPTLTVPTQVPPTAMVVEPTLGPLPELGELEPLQKTGTVYYMEPDMIIDNGDGTEMGLGPLGVLPAGFPENAPMFPGDPMSLSWTLFRPSKTTVWEYHVMISTPMPMEYTIDWYKSWLVEYGWTIDEVITDTTGIVTNASFLIRGSNDTQVIEVGFLLNTFQTVKTDIQIMVGNK